MIRNPTRQFPADKKVTPSNLDRPEFYGIPHIPGYQFGFGRKFKCPVCKKEMGNEHKKSLRAGKKGKWISCSNTKKKASKVSTGRWTTSFQNPHKIKRAKKIRLPKYMNRAEKENWNSKVSI